MAGINRASQSVNENLLKARSAGNVKCVFISHQKDDSKKCNLVADYLMKADIDVYFDEHDKDLKSYRQAKNPRGVVNSIKAGINKSTHMLCVISPNTMRSKWVPWEVGYGYEKTTVGVLTLKGIQEEDLPDYLKTVQIVRGTKSLNEFIEELTGLPQLVLENKHFTLSYNKPSHPLDDVLDWQI